MVLSPGRRRRRTPQPADVVTKEPPKPWKLPGPAPGVSIVYSRPEDLFIWQIN
jgi:hypothetical protein